jgi:hypothetical protein
MELLALDRVARLVERIGREDAPLALNLALARLLIPALQVQRAGRHLVLEPWAEPDLCGQTLVADAPIDLARDLAAEQAREQAAVASGKFSPDGSLATLLWSAVTGLPHLPQQFVDDDMATLARALYLDLVPAGSGMAGADPREVVRRVERLDRDGFAELDIGLTKKKARSAFRRLMAMAVRYAGQLIGDTAEKLISNTLDETGCRPLTEKEQAVIALRYGADRNLGDINVAFLLPCGPRVKELLEEYLRALLGYSTGQSPHDVLEKLKQEMYLLGQFRRRRKQARAAERRQQRERHADPVPVGWRVDPGNQRDVGSPDPEHELHSREEVEGLRDLLRSLKGRGLKPRDAERLGALIDCGGDRKAAADRLGLDLKTFSRRLRQTTLPAVRQMARQLGRPSAEPED